MSTQPLPTDTGAARTPAQVGDPSVQDVLDRFAQALTSGDPAAAGAVWDAPALLLGDSREDVVSSAARLEELFAGARDRYSAKGIVDTRAEVEHFDWLSDRLVLVRVRWPYLDRQRQERGSERSTYVLKRDGDGRWKLRVARVAARHGESTDSEQQSAD